MRVNRAISIGDIAKKTGLSETTVSRVLRDKGDFLETTRIRVREAAQSLGYRPNLHVRAIQSGITHTVGIIGDIVTDTEFRIKIFEGIHGTLSRHDYLVILAYPEAGSTGAEELSLVYRLIDHRIDGLFLFPSAQLMGKLLNVWDMNFPMIALDFDPKKRGMDFVGTDDLLGGRMAAKHLLERGHRHFLYAYAGDFVQRSTPSMRFDGFRQAIQEVQGTSCLTAHAEEAGPGSRKSDYLVEALDKHKDVTAVFAWNDWVAYDAYDACQRLGRVIPADLSVVGFGNLNISRTVVPQLTTFEQSPYEIGVRAAEIFINRVNGKEPAQSMKVRVPPQLVPRESVAPSDERPGRRHRHPDPPTES